MYVQYVVYTEDLSAAGMKHKRHKEKRHRSSSSSSQNGQSSHIHLVGRIASAIAKRKQHKARELLLGLISDIGSMHASSISKLLCSCLQEKTHREIAAGSTLLHVAAQCGDVESIKLLLANGADPNAVDVLKRTPLHVAGAVSARALLAAAQAHGIPVDLAALDASGCSVDDALWMAMREEGDGHDDTYEDEEEKVRRANAIYGDNGDDHEGGSRAARQTEEEAWNARLREESLFEQAEAGVSSFGAWGDADDYADADGENGEDWFSAVAAEVAARNAQRAREAREKAEAAAAAAWGARTAERRGWKHPASAESDGTAAAEERQRRAEEAFRRLQQQEQRARELALRAEARSRYITAWLRLQPPSEASGGATAALETLHAVDFPWPTRSVLDGLRFVRPLTADEVGLHVLSDEEMPDTHSRRKALRAELRRWHPDKFVARYGGRIAAAERQAVLLLVKAVSQCLNELVETRL